MRFRYLCFGLSMMSLMASLASAAVKTATFKDGDADPFLPASTYEGTSRTYINSQSPDANYASSTLLYAQEYSRSSGKTYHKRVLIHFDLSSMLGQYETIQSAELKLYQYASTDATPNFTFTAYQIVDDNAGWVQDDATWNNAKAGTSWEGGPGLGDDTTAGGYLDITPTPQATYTVDGATGTVDKITLPGSLIEHWMTETNAGLLIKTDNPGTSQVARFVNYSPKWYPELVITYTPVPEPTGAFVLMGGTLLLMGSRSWTAGRRRIHAS